MGCECGHGDCCGSEKTMTKEETLKMLKQYQKELEAETKNVAAKIKELSK